MLPSISPHQSSSSTSHPTLKNLHVENIWAFIQRHRGVDMMHTWRCGEPFFAYCVSSFMNKSPVLCNAVEFTHQWGCLLISGQLTALVVWGIDLHHCWGSTDTWQGQLVVLMSADGRDHHPLFSLGAVGRVHLSQACQSANPPPVIPTRQPVSVEQTVFSAGGK